MHINELDTPVVTIDLDKLEANIIRLQNYLDKHGIENRPHIKTHKVPEIAHMQLRAGAVGIACQKLGEAEIMAQAGVRDIFIPYNILGQVKLERLMRLNRRIELSVTADSEITINGLSAAAAGTPLTVLVEFDSGGNRCGVRSPAAAAELARRIARAPGLHFGGLMTYPNTDQTDPFVEQTRSLLSADGIAIERVSGGGTPCMRDVHNHPAITEHRAGTYVYGDRKMIAVGAMDQTDCAMTIITTVVSRPTADRGILDAGSKSLSSDTLGLEGHGLILEYPQAVIYGLSEEHGHVDFSRCETKPTVGERVTVIPNHCCVVSNLFNQVTGIRDNTVEVSWPVAARGALQ